MIHALYYNSFIIPKAEEHLDKLINDMREIRMLILKGEKEKEMEVYEKHKSPIRVGIYALPIYSMSIEKALGTTAVRKVNINVPTFNKYNPT